MEDILKDFKNNIFIDETNSFIYKEHYKEDGFKDNILFSFKQGDMVEISIQECLDKIKPLLSNEKLVICGMPVVMYETKTYTVDEDNILERIVNHLEKNNIVLLFSPIIDNGILKFKSRLL